MMKFCSLYRKSKTLSFYYIIIQKCMKDFIMCKIIAVLSVKKLTVNSSCSWTMKKEVKDLNLFWIYSSVWKPKLKWK